MAPLCSPHLTATTIIVAADDDISLCAQPLPTY